MGNTTLTQTKTQYTDSNRILNEYVHLFWKCSKCVFGNCQMTGWICEDDCDFRLCKLSETTHNMGSVNIYFYR